VRARRLVPVTPGEIDGGLPRIGGQRAPAAIFLVASMLIALFGTALAAPPTQQLGEIVVIGVSPLPGLDVPADQVPLNVQSAQSDDVRQLHGQSFTDLLRENFQGVNLTQSQGNPWQANLLFHGFTLSPLLGSPAGISVYVDGVRQNESFAETMNWEAIPDFAIRDVELVPGSSPLYGRNTLGGALLLTTKSGFTDPGGAFEVSGGSWDRMTESIELGTHGKRFGFFAGAANDHETGWRDYSGSLVQQAFLRGDWHPDDATDVAVSYTGSHAKLYGTQFLPIEWSVRPQAAFTWPDFFTNILSQINLLGTRQLNPHWAVQAHAYVRVSQSEGFNSDTADFEGYDPHSDGPLGYAVDGAYDPDSVSRFFYSGVAPRYDPLDPAATINNVVASNASTGVHTRAHGAAIQVVNNYTWWGRANQLTAGISVDAGSTVFTQFLQPAFFPYDALLRGDTVGLLPFALTPLTDAGTADRDYGVYFADVLALTDAVHLTVGGRYDRSRISVRDRSGTDPAIDGRQTFSRFNPSAGVTWKITPALAAYANYDEGMRTPSPIEIECARPEAPCALPNDFTGDPPLKPVVAHTLSGGLRGTLAHGDLRWNVSPYYTRVDHDILTIFTGGSSHGYFANVPQTLRKGVDLGIGGQTGRLEWRVNYSYTEAIFASAFEEQSEDNSSADESGAIQVLRGDRMPGVPRNSATVAAEYHFNAKWSLGGNLRAYSGQYALGDENNLDVHGEVPGYAVLDLDLHYRPTPRLSIFAQVTNAFDRRYFVSGQLSRNVFDTPDRLTDYTGPGTSTLFVAPGAPRGYFIGIRYGFAGKSD
jgi:iron complex outermembrane receptor protein